MKLFFYPLTDNVKKKSGGNCNIDDPYVRVCVPDKVKIMKVKVFNWMLRVNKTRLLVEHEPCKCKNGMDESECNSKQK